VEVPPPEAVVEASHPDHAERLRAPVPARLRRSRSVVLGAREPRLDTIELRRRARGDAIVVRPLIVGICRSDLKEVLGVREGRSDFGHELVASVEWVQSSAPIDPGDTVCFDPNIPLLRGSGFSELMLAEGDAGAVAAAFPLAPAGAPLARLMFAEPLACAVHTVRRLARELGPRRWPGARVAIIGAGSTGTLLALAAQASGCRVAVYNRARDRLDLLAATGLLEREQLRGLGELAPGTVDGAIVATEFSLAPLVALALTAVADGGTVMLFGGTAPGDRLGVLDLDSIRRHERVQAFDWDGRSVKLAGAYGTASDDFARAFELLSPAGENIVLERLIAETISLQQLAAELQPMAHGRSVGKTAVLLDARDVPATSYGSRDG
jgi:cyclitol reductase